VERGGSYPDCKITKGNGGKPAWGFCRKIIYSNENLDSLIPRGTDRKSPSKEKKPSNERERGEGCSTGEAEPLVAYDRGGGNEEDRSKTEGGSGVINYSLWRVAAASPLPGQWGSAKRILQKKSSARKRGRAGEVKV